MCVIGLAGKAGSGKDTVADILVQEHGFTKLAFADPLKVLCAQIYDVPLEYFHDRERKEVAVPGPWLSPRQMMQRVGDAAKTAFGSGVFVDHLIERTRGIDKVVVTDVRYPAERDTLLIALNASVFVVERDGAGLHGATAAHSSEAGIIGSAGVIHNNGPIQDLRAQVANVVLKLQGA